MVAAMLVVALSPVLLLLALLRWMWRSSTRRTPVSSGVPVV
jgi:hypothetical protein